MKKSWFRKEQVIGVFEYESGVKMTNLCRKHGISAATFYQWNYWFGGMEGVPAENRL